MAQLLKDKYYLNGYLVDTVFTGNTSDVWHGIEYGLKFVKRGMIWIVSSSTSVRVWRDPWIPHGLSLRLVFT